MRIISFSKKWDKLKQPEFTTFRYPRADSDWHVGETVQVYFKNRSPQREKLGEAEIINKERRELDSFFAGVTLTTDAEAVADGFTSRNDMVKYMERQYGLDYSSLFHKLTLKWLHPVAPKVSCKYEDWDDTTSPHPVCHCLKRLEKVDCANAPDDVSQCPDFAPSKPVAPDIELRNCKED